MIASPHQSPSTFVDDEDELEDDGLPPPDWIDGNDDGDGDSDGEPVRWLTVATFWNSTEAHIARIKLESESIDCVILDENLVATDWLWASAVGGIKLKVPEDQFHRASELLHARSRAAPRQSDNEQLDSSECCPRCGSEQVHLAAHGRGLAIVTLVLLGFPFLRRRYHCDACGHKWASNRATKSQ